MTRQRGFTLLETLAALTLFAVCGTLLLRGFADARARLDQARDHARLSVTAQSIMASARVGPLSAGDTQGTWDDRVRWHLHIGEQSHAANGVALYRLELMLDDGSRKQRYVSYDVAQTGDVQ